MKKILLVGMVVMLFGSVALFAQEHTAEEVSAEIQMEIDAAMKEVEEAMEEININILVGRTSEDAPKMGIFLSNMDFEDAYKMHYPYCYGVYVTGVTQDGPAQKAGITKGDIIMEFDGRKAKFESNLVKLIKSKNIGDEVQVKIYRDEEIFIADLTLSTLKPKEMTITKNGMKIKKKKKLSVGYGSGGWLPVWFGDNKFEDINYILDAYGFNGLDEKGILMQGGGGKGNVGKGWFIGGMGAGYSIDKKEGYITNSGNPVTRRIQLDLGYGGVTLDKRFALSKNLIGSLGFLLGGGGYDITVAQSDGDYSWDNLNGNLDNSDNNSITLEKSYILFQPKAMLMVRILPWLGIRSEAGYMFSHSFSEGWDANSVGDTFEIDDSPNTSFDGYTISIGPWFGF